MAENLNNIFKYEEETRSKEMWFFRVLRIPWAKQVSNDEVSDRLKSKRKVIYNMKKRELTFLTNVMMKWVRKI